MSDDPYVYPGTGILINKFGIRDADALEFTEREYVAQRLRQKLPSGAYDLAHLRNIHHYLFQDVYSWAGEIRTVEIAKNGHNFQPVRFIDTGMHDVHRRLTKSGFLTGLSREDFAREAGAILGDVNYVHPFREGNGRTQLQYLRQLAGHAGHIIDLKKLDPAQWQKASRSAHDANYAPMARCIAGALL